jgi:transposase
MKAYSLDLRERVMAACEAGRRTADVAQSFSVSRSWVRRLKQRRREGKPLAAAGRAVPDQRALKDAERGVLRGLVEADPDATLEQLRERVAASAGKVASASAVWRALSDLALTLKKSRRTPPSGSGRT